MTYRRAGCFPRVSPASTPVEALSKRRFFTSMQSAWRTPCPPYGVAQGLARTGLERVRPLQHPGAKKQRGRCSPPSAHSPCPMPPDQHPNHSSRGKKGSPSLPLPVLLQRRRRSQVPVTHPPSTEHQQPGACICIPGFGELFGACLWRAASRSGCGT
jgi:hypothetical protein